MVIWIPKYFTTVFFVVAASSVQQFQTTERETIEAVAQCLNCEPDRRRGGGCKKDQDWTKSLSNWYSKRHGDAHPIIFYSIKMFTGHSHILFHYWKYEPLENMSKWGKDIIRVM